MISKVFLKFLLLISVTFLCVACATVSSNMCPDGECITVNEPLRGDAGTDGGAATYSIDIAAPPGRADMQPYVSVDYQSHNGNGHVGVGWSLNATSSINLCPSIYGEDGRLAGVAYVKTDRLCFDGSHLLVVDGQYGVSGSIYRTFYESFVKIQLHGDIGDRKSFFVVTREDGTKSFYKMPAIALHAPSPVAWFQTLKEDVYGNTIRYEYIQPTPEEVLISRITYTGRDYPGWKAAGNRVIRFQYEPRPDIASVWIAGGNTLMTRRLRAIITGIMPAGDVGELTHIREYYFRYIQSEATGRSLLKSVTGCADDGAGKQHCLTPTTFTWSEHPLRYKPPAPYPVAEPRDVNLSVGNPGQTNTNIVRYRVWNDYNADGRNDLLYAGNGVDPQTAIYVSGQRGTPPNRIDIANYLSDAQAFADNGSSGYFSDAGDAEILGDDHGKLAMMYSYGNGSNLVDRTAIPYNPNILPGQFSGTGRVDILQLRRMPKATYELLLYQNLDSRPGKLAFSSPLKLLSFSGPESKPDSSGYLLRDAGTINGSGYPPVFILDGTSIKWIVFFETNMQHVLKAYAVKPRAYGLNNTTDYHKLYFLDINGDGLLDLVYSGKDKTGTSTWWYQVNTGNGFAAPVDTHVADKRPAVAKGDATLSAPIYIDGRDSLIYPARLQVEYCLMPAQGLKFDKPLCSSGSLDKVAPAADFGIYSYDAIRFGIKPDGTFKPVIVRDLNIIGQAHRVSTGDILGDGLTQFISPFDIGFANGRFRAADGSYLKCPPKYGCGLHVSSSTNIDGEYAKDAAPDMLITAVQSQAAKYVWNYYPLADPERKLYTVPPLNSKYRYLNDDAYYFTSSMYVVGEYMMLKDGGKNEIRYHYGNGGYNGATALFEGFRWITIQSMGKVVKYTNWYHLQYPPFSGNIIAHWSEFDYESGDNLNEGIPGPNFIDYVRYTQDCQGPPDNEYSIQYHCVDSKSPTFLSRKRKIVEQKHEPLSNKPVSTTTTEYDYDIYGNVLHKSYEKDAASHIQVKTTNYDIAPPDIKNWWLDRIDAKEVWVAYARATPPAGSDANDKDLGTSVTDTYYRYNKYRQEISKAVNGSVPYTEVTLYTYEKNPKLADYGELIKIQYAVVRNSDNAEFMLDTRTIGYTRDGYFITSVKDANDGTTTYHVDPATGNNLLKISPNGAVTKYKYDVFGTAIQ
jgi:Salmonella virulence plasmid 65kDa B protein